MARKPTSSPPVQQGGLFDDSAVVLTGFVPSAYQQAIFDWVALGTGDGAVRAVAGSGKTTTLEQAARLVRSGRAIFCAFNKHIADALGQRLKGTPFAARTIHQIGYGILARSFAGSLTVDDRKYLKLAQRWVDQEFPTEGKITAEARAKRVEYAHHLEKLTRFARMTMTDPRDRAALRALAIQYAIDLRELMTAGVAQLIIWGAEQAERSRIVDFTDMVFLPVYLTLEAPQYDWVFADECQDFNVAQRELVLKLRAPGGRMLLVGDPFQSIMAFAGADSSSYDRILTATGAQEFPLSVCFRCPSSHLELARREVPTIEARPGAPVGTIASVPEAALGDLVRAGDLVLCRMTAPLIGWCLKLIERMIPARVRGRDIAEELTDLARKVGRGGSYQTFLIRLGMYAREHRAYLEQQEASESALQMHDDRCAALVTCYEGFTQCASVDAQSASIDGLFADEGATIWLSTVHRAKGLEADRVFILNPHHLPLRWPEQTAEDERQERNVAYVAMTRSRDTLVFLETPESIAAGDADRRMQRYDCSLAAASLGEPPCSTPPSGSRTAPSSWDAC